MSPPHSQRAGPELAMPALEWAYPEVSRRRFLLAAATAGCMAAGLTPAAEERKLTGMGIVAYALGLRQKASAGKAQDLSDPRTFVEYCARIGAGGAQISLGSRDEAYVSALRRFVEEHELRLEALLELPKSAAAIERFEKEVATARAAGADVARVVVIPGRRYEYFNTAEQFAQASKTALELLQRAEPIAARHRLRLAVENHKCQRIGERIDLLKRLSSEYIGICVDVGNSIALCEDPIEVIRAYAPWAMTVHLKDHQVQPYDQGFLLADAALGKGFLDLPGMIRILRQARPAIRFHLEAITRDPLRVPVLAEKYWASMGQVPAADLARTVRLVKGNASAEPLETVSHLPLEKQVEVETRNVRQSLAYAAEHLRL